MVTPEKFARMIRPCKNWGKHGFDTLRIMCYWNTRDLEIWNYENTIVWRISCDGKKVHTIDLITRRVIANHDKCS